MRTFARYAAAAEDPDSIVDRLAAGSITPEDAEVMREVYPEKYAQITAHIAAHLPELRASLPYQRRLALSIFSGVPVDPAMHPEVLSVLQAQFDPGARRDAGGAARCPSRSSARSRASRRRRRRRVRMEVQREPHDSYGGSCSSSGCSGGARIVTYTATGTEAGSGLDFFVPITDEDGDPVTLAADDYYGRLLRHRG
jgi:hypothetical protein